MSSLVDVQSVKAATGRIFPVRLAVPGMAAERAGVWLSLSRGKISGAARLQCCCEASQGRRLKASKEFCGS